MGSRTPVIWLETKSNAVIRYPRDYSFVLAAKPQVNTAIRNENSHIRKNIHMTEESHIVYRNYQ